MIRYPYWGPSLSCAIFDVSKILVRILRIILWQRLLIQSWVSKRTLSETLCEVCSYLMITWKSTVEKFRFSWGERITKSFVWNSKVGRRGNCWERMERLVDWFELKSPGNKGDHWGENIYEEQSFDFILKMVHMGRFAEESDVGSLFRGDGELA